MKGYIHSTKWVIAFTVFTIAAQADDDVNPQMTSGSQKVANKSQNCVINPPVRPLVEKGYGVFATGSFLWWKAIQDDLHYVSKAASVTCPGNFLLNSYDGKLYNPDFKWDYGFELGLGYNLPYDGWDLYANWIRFDTSAKNKHCGCLCPPGANANATRPVMQQPGKCNGINVPPTCPPCADIVLFPTFAPVITSDQYATTLQASSHWNLHLNLIDGELGRDFYVSKKLTLRPSIGIRGAFVDQTLDVNYRSNLNIINPINAGFGIDSASLIGTASSCSKFENDFQGVGPKFGIDTDWILGKGFSIYGNAAIALVWGEFDIESNSVFNICADFEATTVTLQSISQLVNESNSYRLRQEFHSTKAMTDLALGVQWQMTFMDRIGLLLQLGWDHHLLFNQNQMIRLLEQFTPFPLAPLVPGILQSVIPNLTTTEVFVTPRRNGDLSLQGLTFTARLDF